MSELSRTPDSATIRFGGSEVSGPSFVAAGFAHISTSQDPFTVDSLPDELLRETKIEVVRRLLAAGFLEVVS